MPSPVEYRNLELEAAAATAVGRRPTVLGGAIRIGVPLGAIAIAGWMIYGSLQGGPENMTKPGEEEFTTTPFPAPTIDAPQPPTPDNTIVIPAEPAQPPEPPPPEPPADLPPPPPEPPLVVTPVDDGEAERLAELERQRLEEEERRRWERLRAPQVIADNAALPGEGDAVGDDGREGSSNGTDDDPNRRFLASVSNAGVEVAKAVRNERIDALVAQGTMIRGVLETALQSDLPGMVRAVTTENVWSFDGQRVLIPAGSRLVGEYRSGIAQGQTRVFVVWTRLLRSDGVSVQLGSNGTDELGRAGNTGFVDNHYVQRFGSAILLSVVGGAAQFLGVSGQGGDDDGGDTVVTVTDPVTGRTVTTRSDGGGGDGSGSSGRRIVTEGVAQTFSGLAEEALENSIDIPPTIHLDQGSRIAVFVRRDLDFSAFYPDPVKEALRELRRERGGKHP